MKKNLFLGFDKSRMVEKKGKLGDFVNYNRIII